MTDRVCLHCYVSGRVQGVWFRANTKEQADKLGLSGWVRNLPDGRVEVMACGEKDNVAQLFTWLKRGPELAKVTELNHEVVPWEDHQGFNVI